MQVFINSQWQASGSGQAYPIGAEKIRNLLCLSVDLTVPDVSFEPASFDVTEGVRNYHEIQGTLNLASEAMRNLSTPVFNLGCDCGGEFIPIAKLNERFGGDLRVIWFDAHPDLNTPLTSTSKTFHGMVLRALLGDTPPGFERHLPVPLNPKNVILAGVRSIDPGERDYIAAHRLSVISSEELNTAIDTEKLKPLDGGPVYIHVDYDVLDPMEHPNAVYKVASGIRLSMLIDWLRAIRQTQDVV
ncbi:MAG: arginase family protein, partial [Pseudomonadota bacterium]